MNGAACASPRPSARSSPRLSGLRPTTRGSRRRRAGGARQRGWPPCTIRVGCGQRARAAGVPRPLEHAVVLRHELALRLSLRHVPELALWARPQPGRGNAHRFPIETAKNLVDALKNSPKVKQIVIVLFLSGLWRGQPRRRTGRIIAARKDRRRHGFDVFGGVVWL